MPRNRAGSRTLHLIWVVVSLAQLCTPSFASTIAMVSGASTTDGRPLLIKNRDNSSNDNQEFYYNNHGPYHYISVTYAGVTNQAWGGVNELGFAVNNANAWNFADSVVGPDDDGYIMDLALRTCQTVDDFQAIMDSTNVTGRTLPAIYGVVDASGDGAMFEAASYEYYRFDLDDSVAAPNGYMVRANFAYMGGPYHLGQHRHDRVMALLDSAYAGGFISHSYATQTILVDIVNEEIDPYPLPFNGREDLLPYGLILTHDAVNRDITRAGFAIQGILPGENPFLCTIWALVGEPICTPALPLWVYAGSTPVEFDGPTFSSLNVKAHQFRDYLYQTQWASDAMDTWKLVDEDSEGLLPFLTSVEDSAAMSADSALEAWRAGGLPPQSDVEAFQNGLAAGTLADMESWGPPQAPLVAILLETPSHVTLDWVPVNLDVFNRPITVSAYTVYASDQPFINRLKGDSVTTVMMPPVTIQAAETHRFFQVRCIP